MRLPGVNLYFRDLENSACFDMRIWLVVGVIGHQPDNEKRTRDTRPIDGALSSFFPFFVHCFLFLRLVSWELRIEWGQVVGEGNRPQDIQNRFSGCTIVFGNQMKEGILKS